MGGIVTKKGKTHNNNWTPLLKPERSIDAASWSTIIYMTRPTSPIHIQYLCLLSRPNSEWIAHNINANSLLNFHKCNLCTHKSEIHSSWFTKSPTTQAFSVLMIVWSKVVPTWPDIGATDETQWAAKLSMTENTKLKIHVLLPCQNFHICIHFSPKTELSPLHSNSSNSHHTKTHQKKTPHFLPLLQLSALLFSYDSPTLYPFSLLRSILPHVPVTHYGFL